MAEQAQRDTTPNGYKLKRVAMKVKDLLQEIKDCEKEYGQDFLDWEVYTEQIDEDDRKYKKAHPEWKWLTDSEDFEYLQCAGFWTKFLKQRVFTINVNY